MVMTTPVKNGFFLKWLHAGLYQSAANLECHSCENFLTLDSIQHYMVKKRWHGLVVTDIKKPVAYVLFRKYARGRSIHLMNLVVHSDYRRKGVGTILVDQLKSRMNAYLFPNILCMVRESNLATHMFLQNSGFVATKVERNFFVDEYPDEIDKEDAFVFRYDLELP